ncbi:PIKK family atypical protein kinase [Trichomonas vaginalis G3]|uniref:Serine/threonine-protein kinase TOR n=1 Tax=Trichomonas vaginalis (strain ATCC PRA-98 / G3) TaxID=412133 RepID=A2FKG3_TRIV3|nr:ataxia telangiectasia mutated (ATM) -related family [Trichomonas vaginalis G3]EAX94604.1 PIKK family atypical protein kinase [Trichomonas vaginalis G3]KAI5513456.1 ataxia telangiectasia mutated (ATM) -related family [Trichomonas vaginalis G3]|eukprot:XP_001307534.1 PIKK family atypical protein kinase [Trichomonas vaginalis G3]
MNLKDLKIPTKCSDMINTYQAYYQDFYMEMVHISNSSLNEHVEEFLSYIQSITTSPAIDDIMRAAMGVTCLHEFGYDNFPRLVRIFDRLIPQVDYEYVKFTSWCAGKLVVHPGYEQSRYVTHLFERIIGWIRARGRRSRHLAAVCMLEQISLNAGTDVVPFLMQLQPAIWTLISHPSMRLIDETAKAISRYTRAILRYRRLDIDNYLGFLTSLSTKLLSLDNPTKTYAGLKLIESLIESYPDYFIPSLEEIHYLITDTTTNRPILVKNEMFVAISYLALVDPKQFSEIASDLFDNIEEIIVEFPSSIAEAIYKLCQNAPDFVKNKIDLIKSLAPKILFDIDSVCTLLRALLDAFDIEALPISEVLIKEILDQPFSESINSFIVSLAKAMDKDMPSWLIKNIHQKIINEYQSNTLLVLNLISLLPSNAIYDAKGIMNLVSDSSPVASLQVRKLVPNAIFNVAMSSNNQRFMDETVQKIFQLAIFDPSNEVRCSILNVLKDNPSKELASPASIKFLQLFSNDDSTSVKTLVFKTIAELGKLNPLYVSNITRHSILEHLYIIKNDPDVRLRARTVKTLPDLIKAASFSGQIYAKPFMDIAIEILSRPLEKDQIENFLDRNGQTKIIIGIIDSIALMAPVAPDVVSSYATTLIPILGEKLSPNEDRMLILAIMHLFFVLLSPPASTLQYRVMTPYILQCCSQFLAQTQSRKCRMATLRVIGAIGILEVHQRPPPKNTQAPKNINETLAREFFTFSRDIDESFDDTLLINEQTWDQLYSTVVANVLLKVLDDESLKEMYPDTCHALCQVLGNIKMYMLSQFDQFFDKILTILENSNENDLGLYLPVVSDLITMSTLNCSPFVERTLKILITKFNDKDLLQILDIIVSFVTVLKDGFAPYASLVISLMVHSLERFKSTNLSISSKILEAFSEIGIYASDLNYLIIPQISDVVISEHVLMPVRVSAILSIDKLASSVDLYYYLGSIIRAVNYGLGSKDAVLTENTLKVIMTLLKTQGKKFLINSMTLFNFMKISGFSENKELQKCIQEAETIENFTPIIKVQSINKNYKKVTHILSQDAIVARAMTPALGHGRHLEEWLHSFIISCISSSPSKQIRVCTNLATNYHKLAIALFKIAFFSCWQEINESGRQTITSSFHEILLTSDAQDRVASTIMDLIFFMSKFENPIKLPVKDLTFSALRFGSNAFALCLLQDSFNNDTTVDPGSCVVQLIDTYLSLGDWDNAAGVWTLYKTKTPGLEINDTMAKLKMWDQVLPLYKRKYEQYKDNQSLSGMIRTMSHIGLWNEMIPLKKDFDQMNRSVKRELAPYFSRAAFSLGKWDILEEVSQYNPDDNIHMMLLDALQDIKKGNYDIDQKITNCWSTLASRPITFWADNLQIHRETMLIAQQIVEVLEIRDWAKNPNMREEIESVWLQRMRTAPRDFELWFRIITNRFSITQKHDELFLNLFQMKSSQMGTKMNSNVFNSIFPDLDFKLSPDIDRLCFVINHWTTGEKKKALLEMKNLTETVKIEKLSSECHSFYASWRIELDDSCDALLDAYEHFKKVPVINSLIQNSKKSDSRSKYRLTRFSSSAGGLYLPSTVVKSLEYQVKDINNLRKWSNVNIELITKDPMRTNKYVMNAISALSQLCTISPSFTDVVQILNLFFEHAEETEVFDQTKQIITTVEPKLLLQASSQILVQLNHPSKNVAQFVHQLLLNLLEEHYHALIFSLIVNRDSKNQSRAQASRDLYEEFSNKHPEESNEVIEIRKCLLRAAVTWYEKSLQKISDAFDNYSLQRIDAMIVCLQKILKMSKKPKCELHNQFLKQYSNQLNNLEKLLNSFDPHNQNMLNNISQWCRLMQDSISEDIRKVKIIRLSSLSQIGNKTHFKLAVPGTYKPGKKIIRIEYFVGQFNVYMSKQQPKDVVVRGEDGNFYQYLVKGHEDLRLDERVMQFFHLVNSFIKKETSFGGQIISTMSVIPLSIQHGLVQWVRGTDTLRGIVENYRRLYETDPMIEYTLLEQLSHQAYDYMLPIQKQQIIDKVCSLTPDTDIAQLFQLKAESSNVWLKQTRTFAMTAAITSIVGYIIGLGDRHPSNLLIDRLTGKIVHIDFGDSFEKAAKRKFLPEVVPFRLTRMMVKAMGVAGVCGAFRTTFINLAQLLRDNRRVLVMVLSIFVHEPLVDNEDNNDYKNNGETHVVDVVQQGSSIIDKGRLILADNASQQSSIEMRNRVNQKLSGMDFDNKVPLTVEQQADMLISLATSRYQLAKMYSGWCPFW